MNEQLYLRILSGEASEAEKEEFYTYLQANKEEEDVFFEVRSLWIKSSLSSITVDENSEFKKLWRKLETHKKSTSIYQINTILKYAAVILIILFAGIFAGYYIFQNQHQSQKFSANIFKSLGGVSYVQLSDGSKVWLNSGSELTFTEDFKNRKRLAKLKGEGYFEVKHKADLPLFVEVGQVIVRDLGTTFNIKTYSQDSIVTTLISGKADILGRDGKILTGLKPGETATYSSNTKSVNLRWANEGDFGLWRTGRFVVINQPLYLILEDMGQQYGVKFKLTNPKIRNVRLSLNIKKETSLDNLIKMLRITTKYHYQMMQNKDIENQILVY